MTIVGSNTVTGKNIDRQQATTIVGSNAIVEKKDRPQNHTTKGKIRDHLIEKYKAEQEIKKQEYDADPPNHGWSDEEMRTCTMGCIQSIISPPRISRT
jgi:hypothetical protein